MKSQERMNIVFGKLLWKRKKIVPKYIGPSGHFVFFFLFGNSNFYNSFLSKGWKLKMSAI